MSLHGSSLDLHRATLMPKWFAVRLILKDEGIMHLLAALSAANLSTVLDSTSICSPAVTMRSKGATVGFLETNVGLHRFREPSFEARWSQALRSAVSRMRERHQPFLSFDPSCCLSSCLRTIGSFLSSRSFRKYLHRRGFASYLELSSEAR